MKKSFKIAFCVVLISLLLSSCNAPSTKSDIATVDTFETISPINESASDSGGIQLYKDLDGDSGVYAYEYGADYIRVIFTTGAIYLYTYDSAGADNIEQMKMLADYGDGLNAYINSHVSKLYSEKEK